MQGVSCSFSLRDHDAVVVGVSSLLILVQHLIHRQLMCRTMVYHLVRHMLIMRGTSLHAQGMAMVGERDWALVKATCTHDELGLYSLIIDTYQHAVCWTWC